MPASQELPKKSSTFCIYTAEESRRQETRAEGQMATLTLKPNQESGKLRKNPL